jgi:hypothetical protein
MCQIKRFMPVFTRICRSQEIGQLSDQTGLRGDEKGETQKVQGKHSDDRRTFLTILDNFLTVGGSAGGEKRAGGPQPQSGGLPEGGGGMKNGAMANFAEALRQ